MFDSTFITNPYETYRCLKRNSGTYYIQIKKGNYKEIIWKS